MTTDIEVFGGKRLSDILEEVHNKTEDNRKLILDIIRDLQKLSKGNSGEAAVFYPIIKEYLIALVASDTNLVKIATIVQRIVSAESYTNKSSGTIDLNSILSESERKQIIETSKKELREMVDEVAEEISIPDLEHK